MTDLVEIDSEGVEQISLKQYTEKAYLDYSMYVILDRALPHVGDGLKPVQRRIVYAMSELGLKASAKFKKLPTCWTMRSSFGHSYIILNLICQGFLPCLLKPSITGLTFFAGNGPIIKVVHRANSMCGQFTEYSPGRKPNIKKLYFI